MSVKPACWSVAIARMLRLPDMHPSTTFASFGNTPSNTRMKSGLGCIPPALWSAKGALEERLARVDAARESHLAAVAAAKYYIDYSDFSVWVLRVHRVRWVGGYGRMDSATDVAKVSVIGIGMRSHAGVAAQAFKALAERNARNDEGIAAGGSGAPAPSR